MANDDVNAILKQAAAARRDLLERIGRQPSVEVIGVVDSVAGFGGPDRKPSLSISLSHWKKEGGSIERGALYIRREDIEDGELDAMRRILPECTVARFKVKLDVEWRASALQSRQLLDAIYVEVIGTGVQDEELDAIARRIRQEQASAPLGRPAFDPVWLLFDFLARFVSAPELPIVHLGKPLPGDGWSLKPEGKDAPSRDGRQVFERESAEGKTTATVRRGAVAAVRYDFHTYRETGLRRMKKLQTLIAAHGRESGKLHRFHDNGAGAMLYTDRSRTYEAVYAYNADRLFIRSRDLSA